MLLLSIVTVISSCALPRQRLGQQEFVPKRELIIVSLAKKGQDYADKGRYLEGELALRQALFLEPNSRALKLELGKALVRQGLFEEAEELYNTLLAENPKSIQTILGKGVLLRVKGDFEGALQQFQTAEKLLIPEVSPQSRILLAEVYQNISIVEFTRGFDEEARCAAKQATLFDGSPVRYARYLRLLTADGFSTQALGLINGSPALRSQPVILQQETLALAGLGNAARASLIAQALLSSENVPASGVYDARWIEVLTSDTGRETLRDLSTDSLEDMDEISESYEFILQNAVSIQTDPSVIYWPGNMLLQGILLARYVEELGGGQ